MGWRRDSVLILTWKLAHTAADECTYIDFILLHTEERARVKDSSLVVRADRYKVTLTRRMTESIADVVVLP